MDGMTGIPSRAYSGTRVKDSLKVINGTCLSECSAIAYSIQQASDYAF